MFHLSSTNSNWCPPPTRFPIKAHPTRESRFCFFYAIKRCPLKIILFTLCHKLVWNLFYKLWDFPLHLDEVGGAWRLGQPLAHDLLPALRRFLLQLVLLDPSQEVVTATGVLHVLHTQVDSLGNYAIPGGRKTHEKLKYTFNSTEGLVVG